MLLELATNLRVCDETRRHRFLSSHIDALKAFGRQLEAKDPTGGDEPGSNDIVELFLNLGRRCASENKKQRPEMREVLDELKDALTFCKRASVFFYCFFLLHHKYDIVCFSKFALRPLI